MGPEGHANIVKIDDDDAQERPTYLFTVIYFIFCREARGRPEVPLKQRSELRTEDGKDAFERERPEQSLNRKEGKTLHKLA